MEKTIEMAEVRMFDVIKKSGKFWVVDSIVKLTSAVGLGVYNAKDRRDVNVFVGHRSHEIKLTRRFER